MKKHLAAFIIFGSSLAHAQIADLPNPWEENTSVSVPVSTTSQQKGNRSSVEIAKIPRLGGGTLYTLTLKKPLRIDELQISVTSGRATLYKVIAISSDGKKNELSALKSSRVLEVNQGVQEKEKVSRLGTLQALEILAESQQTEATLSVLLISQNGSTQLSVKKAEPASNSTAAPTGLVTIDRALALGAPFTSIKDLKKFNVYFSFKSDIYFYPSQETVELSNNCFARRNGGNKAIRVPANKLLKVNRSDIGFPRIYHDISSGEGVGVFCQDSNLTLTMSFYELIKEKVNVYYEMPRFKTAEAYHGVKSGESVTLQEAIAMGVKDASSFEDIKNLTAYLSVKKDIYIFPGQDSVEFNSCVLVRKFKGELYTASAVRIPAGRKFRVMGARYNYDRDATLAFLQKGDEVLYLLGCNDTGSMISYLDQLEKVIKVEVVLPRKSDFETWP